MLRQLRLQLADLVRIGRLRVCGGLLAFAAVGALGARQSRERAPHRHGLLEHRHVLARLLLIGLEGRRRIGEGRRELRAKPLLLLGEVLEAELQVARHHAADAVVVEADQLAQERHRQQRLPADAAFLLDDDLGQHRVGEVVARLGVVDDEVAIAAHHGRQIFQRHVGARLSIIETAIGIFLDDNRFFSRGFSAGASGLLSMAGAATAWFLQCGSVTHPRLKVPAVCVDRFGQIAH